MEMIQNGIAEGLMETIRRDHCEQGVPVIGCEQSAKEVDAINMPDLLDITAQEPEEPIRIDIRIPENISQFGSYVHLRFRKHTCCLLSRFPLLLLFSCYLSSIFGVSPETDLQSVPI